MKMEIFENAFPSHENLQILGLLFTSYITLTPHLVVLRSLQHWREVRSLYISVLSFPAIVVFVICSHPLLLWICKPIEEGRGKSIRFLYLNLHKDVFSGILSSLTLVPPVTIHQIQSQYKIAWPPQNKSLGGEWASGNKQLPQSPLPGYQVITRLDFVMPSKFYEPYHSVSKSVTATQWKETLWKRKES